MKAERALRAILVGFVLLAILVVLGLTLSLADSALDLMDRLRAGPRWQLFLVAGTIALVLGSFLYWITRLLLFGKARSAGGMARVLDEEALTKRLQEAREQGIDTDQAEAELARRDAPETVLEVAVFGEVSAGKSSIVSALVPEATPEVSPLAGSTVNAERYQWTSSAGAAIELIDMPGISGIEELDTSITDQALRAHLVIYVCDADLTASDASAMQRLIRLDKPLVVVLNKADQFTPAELDRLVRKMHERIVIINPDTDVTIAPVIAGGSEQVIEVSTNGDETRTTRIRATDIDELLVALNHMVQTHHGSLMQRRKRSLFYLAAEQLGRAESKFRSRRAAEIIRSHTLKAVVGALAAVSPGTDIVIQGYLGHSLVKRLAELYGQTISDVDIDKLLDLSQSRVGKAVPLSLAVAGNGLKAFPGVGTVTGGLVHAVAYGLIFDAMGRSLSISLEAGRPIDPVVVADSLDHLLAEKLDSGVARVARLAISQLGQSK